ncbi:hypothetical protein LJB84_01320 [Bacteroidales bacterium OttesenSCG-928-J19]|nr:hypothetical protein [Bacteroidales bacterium OttesenSCG-928-J19]
MKNKITLLMIVCFLIIGFQSSIAQISINEDSSLKESGLCSSNVDNSPSSLYLSSESNKSPLLRSNDWGGGDDAPDPEAGDLSTSGAAPIGDGWFILLAFAGIYAVTRRHKKETRYEC